MDVLTDRSGGVTLRGYEPTDAAAVAGLVNLIGAHAGVHATATPDDIQAMVSSVGQDARLGVAPDGTLVAAALNLAPPPGGFRFDVMGGVHPRWRGRGLGRTLFRWQLGCAAELHRAVAADRPWEVRAKTAADDTDAIRLYRRFGLTPARYWLTMATRIPPPGPPPPLPVGLRAVPYTDDLEEPLHAAHMEAFTDHWRYQTRGRAEWAGLTVRSPAFAADLSLVALDGTGEIAGYLLSYQDADPDRLYLGQAGVRRFWRGRGLATALTARVLALAAMAGKRTAGLVTDADNPSGAVTVGERAGFTVESRGVTYTATVPPPHSP